MKITIFTKVYLKLTKNWKSAWIFCAFDLKLKTLNENRKYHFLLPVLLIFTCFKQCEWKSNDIRFALLRFALWWLDLILLSGPDTLRKGRVTGFHILFSMFSISLKKEVIWKPFFISITQAASFSSARGAVVESDGK